MCSISWEWPTVETDVFSILFNRDEQKERPIALPPEVKNINGVKSLMPVDPVGDGSWFAVNEYGLVITLLNLYEVEILPKKLISRGLLVKELSGCKSAGEAIKLLEEKTNPDSATSFAPFSLFIFDKKKKSMYFAQWDQKSLVEQNIKNGVEHQFFCSSSWNTKEVQIYRNLAYKKYYSEALQSKSKFNDLRVSGDIELRRKFHKGANQNEKKSSVYMTREKTQTVSVIELIVDNKTISLDYYDRSSNTSRKSSIALL